MPATDTKICVVCQKPFTRRGLKISDKFWQRRRTCGEKRCMAENMRRKYLVRFPHRPGRVNPLDRIDPDLVR